MTNKYSQPETYDGKISIHNATAFPTNVIHSSYMFLTDEIGSKIMLIKNLHFQK